MTAEPSHLFDRLAALGIRTETTEHAAVFTVAESQGIKGALPGAHTKNLFLKDKKGRLFLVTARDTTVVDLKRLHERVGASGRFSFGSGDLLLEVLAVPGGSVTPLAAMNDPDGRVTVVLDETLAGEARINCHPLRNTATMGIAAADLERFLRETGHEPLWRRLDAAPDCSDDRSRPSPTRPD